MPTVPGYHLRDGLSTPSIDKYGHMAVRRILNDEGNTFPQLQNSHIICQFSSFSTVDENLLEGLSRSLGAGRDMQGMPLGVEYALAPKAKGSKGKRQILRTNLQLCWCTRLEVRDSLEGYCAGSSMPCNLDKVESKNINLKPLLHPWSGNRDGGGSALVAARHRAVPHLKTWARVDGSGQRVAWVILTSSNMSGAAWGKLQKPVRIEDWGEGEGGGVGEGEGERCDGPRY